jgi:hypothetical protein
MSDISMPGVGVATPRVLSAANESYFAGGLVGSAILGQLFDRLGWAACVAGIAASLAIAMLLAFRLKMPAASSGPRA